MTYVGQPVRRKEDRRLLTGRGCFIADLRLPGMVEAAIVRSTEAHARLRQVNAEAARAIAGVAEVFTAAELAGRVTPFTRPFYKEAAPSLVEQSGLTISPYRCDVLAGAEVFWVGQPVAAVVAADRYVAEDAAEAMEVEYDPLKVVADVEQAVAEDAPQLHPDVPGNVHARFLLSGGDTEQAFASAEHHLSERITIHRAVGVPMETRGVVASYERGRGELTVWASNQRPHLLRTYLCEMLGLAEEQVRVISPDMGGSFGGGLYPEDIVVAFAAMELGRPVRWIEDRQENLGNARHGRDQVHYVDVAFNGDGRLVGLRDHFLVDSGACNPFTITLSFNTATHLRSQYRIDNFSVEGLCVATNKLPNTPIRGAGRPEATFVIDRVLDIVARELRMDPAEIRFRNLIPAEAMPFDTGMPYRDGTPMVYDSGNYPEQLRKALKLIGYEDLRAQQAARRSSGSLMGIGISAHVEGSGYGPHEGAIVRIDATGHVVVVSGSNPHGQSHETTLSQVCADALGVTPEDVTVRTGDTGLIQHGGGTFASRSAVTAGSAVYMASLRLREKVQSIAAGLLEANPADIEISRGQAFVRGDPACAMGLVQIAEAASPAPGSHLPAGIEPGLEAQSYFIPPTVTFSSATHVAVVEVDPETGVVNVVRYAVVDECGRILNPMVVDGQQQGGVVHGIGNALYEEAIYDDNGQPLTTTFMDYLLPSATEAPRIELAHQEYPSPRNPLGVKGCGEGGAVSPPAAIVNAVADALRPLRVRLNEIPLTPERLVRAIAEASANDVANAVPALASEGA